MRAKIISVRHSKEQISVDFGFFYSPDEVGYVDELTSFMGITRSYPPVIKKSDVLDEMSEILKQCKKAYNKTQNSQVWVGEEIIVNTV